MKGRSADEAVQRYERSTAQGGAAPSLYQLIVANKIRLAALFGSILLFLAGFGTGRLLTVWQLSFGEEANPAVITINLPDASSMPVRDVSGSDIEGLPRYPGAVRVEYRYEVYDDLAETEVEYVVVEELERVHNFYRRAFDEAGWTVADLSIYQGEWTFFVVAGEREALVELEARQSLVEIEIEISEPVVR